MNEPYVVSEDIYLLLRHWAREKDFILPEESFFKCLRNEFTIFFQRIFSNFEMVPEKEMADGIRSIVNESGLIPVSLDKSYYLSDHNFEITRFVDLNKNDVGLRERHGASCVDIQLQILQRELEGREIILIDDVIFSGDAIEQTIKKISQLRIKVLAVCSGIGIKKGIDRLIFSGHKVDCVRIYESVIDEVCERDFYPGVPLSGRSIASQDNVGVPYILPFGEPKKWASIPNEWQKSLSIFCIEQTIKLFEEIERKSGKMVKCIDLDRKVATLPTGEERYVDCLKKTITDI